MAATRTPQKVLTNLPLQHMCIMTHPLLFEQSGQLTLTEIGPSSIPASSPELIPPKSGQTRANAVGQVRFSAVCPDILPESARFHPASWVETCMPWLRCCCFLFVANFNIFNISFHCILPSLLPGSGRYRSGITPKILTPTDSYRLSPYLPWLFGLTVSRIVSDVATVTKGAWPWGTVNY